MTSDDFPTPEVLTDANQSPRRRRIVLVGVACTVVLVAATVLVVTGGNGKSHRVRVAAPETTTSAPETTTTDESTSTSTASTTSSFPDTEPPFTPGTEASTTTLPAVVAQAPDLEGTLTLDRATLVAGQPNGFTLTVRNITDHAIGFDWQHGLGVWIDGYVTEISGPEDSAKYATWVGEPDLALAAGEQRSFTSATTPIAELAGTSANVRATIIHSDGFPPHFIYESAEYIGGVPATPVSIMPPGQTAGRPLDPSLGKWSATLSTDTTTATLGAAVMLNATVRNTGDQIQRTNGYGSLAVVCSSPSGAWERSGMLLGNVDLAPGSEHSFAVELHPHGILHGSDANLGEATCFVGLAFYGADGRIEPHGIVAEPLTINARPVDPSTTQP